MLPALEALLPCGTPIQGLLAPGHVCAVTGYRDYELLDLLHGVPATVRQLEAGTCRVENAYARVLSRDGNAAARRMVEEVFAVADREWRGLGEIPRSGLGLAPKYARFDAERKDRGAQCLTGRMPAATGEPHWVPVWGLKSGNPRHDRRMHGTENPGVGVQFSPCPPFPILTAHRTIPVSRHGARRPAIPFVGCDCRV